ncbi:prenylated Rab acceptor protein 1 [Astyanax mexicanus]|uniref:PRA1 family protein n=1 Tax=Astyanax mexicanus TaxID=7994 RepID=A0A8B9KVZ8_ASTMX|nr:prenylated Rab acceptor protein 1 [Astyanax mexicanus]
MYIFIKYSRQHYLYTGTYRRWQCSVYYTHCYSRRSSSSTSSASRAQYKQDQHYKMDSKLSDPFSSDSEELPTAGIMSRLLPKGMSGSMMKEWLDRRRKSIRPWAGFVDQRKFSKPKNFGELCQRVVRNLDVYQSNYTFIFLGLILYCIISSPMLLIALAVFVGAFYIIHLKSLESKLVVFGRELTPGHQLGLAGAVSLPVFWLAGAGAAVFWVLGATLAVIGTHAAFRELESSDVEELLMESV